MASVKGASAPRAEPRRARVPGECSAAGGARWRGTAPPSARRPTGPDTRPRACREMRRSEASGSESEADPNDSTRVFGTVGRGAVGSYSIPLGSCLKKHRRWLLRAWAGASWRCSDFGRRSTPLRSSELREKSTGDEEPPEAARGIRVRRSMVAGGRPGRRRRAGGAATPGFAATRARNPAYSTRANASDLMAALAAARDALRTADRRLRRRLRLHTLGPRPAGFDPLLRVGHLAKMCRAWPAREGYSVVARPLSHSDPGATFGPREAELDIIGPFAA
ncbi:hypothetical protein DFJ74DRAFT_422740 [Hyaloraphidium curvatum]|nr:hypothetical protein DFJ74DRAFT_422740 [Hyaloraphidium curvatum]